MALRWNGNIRVIGNCINVDDIRMKPSWERRKCILFLSRVHVKKGINFLIEAVAQLKEEMEGYVVKIAGPGEEAYINELKGLAERLGVGEGWSLSVLYMAKLSLTSIVMRTSLCCLRTARTSASW